MTPRRKAAAAGQIPGRFHEMEDEVGHTVAAISAGGVLYREYCAACHGKAGEGDGPKAQDLGPQMPSIADTIDLHSPTDAYLLWIIFEGGKPFRTRKPAFADKLTARQAWRLIRYMRAKFPKPAARSATR
jgi:mono/diheme cytochrome c family protein